MSLLNKIEYDASRPLISRAGGRALVGSLNFSIMNLIQQHLRIERFGYPTNGVDTMNEEAADTEERAEAERVRQEQGFVTPEDPLVLAGKLRLVRDAVAHDLEVHAARRPMITDPSKTLPDPFHVANSFADSLEFQMKLAPRISEAQIKQEAEALDVSTEEIRTALLSRHNRQLQYLKDNKDEIEKLYENLCAKGTDGHPVPLEDAENVFDALPAIYKLRIAAAVDKGLFRARQREIEMHLAGRPDAQGNIGLIDGERRELLDMVARWSKTPDFARDLEAAVQRGSNLPVFAPAPKTQEKKAA